MNDCPFCNIPKDDIVQEFRHFVVINDRYPVSMGHTLIISKRHVLDYFDLNFFERSSLACIIYKVKQFFETNIFTPDGYNIGMNCGEAAGQTVSHFHCHVIPRYEGDVKDPKGGIRGVIPDKRIY